jgi:hypothetical protein
MKIILFVITFILSACGGVKVPETARISFVEDVNLTDRNGQKIKLNRGDTVELSDNPIEISAEGKKSLMILPMASDGKMVKVKLSNLSVDDLDQNLKSSYNKNLEQLLTGIVIIQKEMAKRNNTQAKSELEKIRKNFPDIAILKFIEANIYLLEGNRAEAKKLLEQGIIQYPDNNEAVKLYRQLLEPGEKDVTRGLASEVEKENTP